MQKPDICIFLLGKKKSGEIEEIMETIQEKNQEPNGDISVHALIENIIHHTIIVPGVVTKKAVTTLVESNISHNFLNFKIIDQTNWIIHQITPLMVTISNGNML